MNYSHKIVQVNMLFKKNSVPVMNSPRILQWMVDNQTESYKLKKKCLSANISEELTKIFGKQNTTITLEFRHKVWILKLAGDKQVFNVFSAKGKGTSIEICDATYDDVNSGKYNSQIRMFLETLSELVHNA